MGAEFQDTFRFLHPAPKWHSHIAYQSSRDRRRRAAVDRGPALLGHWVASPRDSSAYSQQSARDTRQVSLLMGAVYHSSSPDEGGWSLYRGLCPPAQEGLMHVRYAHNTREHLGGIEQGKGKDTTLILTLPYLTYIPTFLLCPRPAEYLVSPVA